MSELQARMGELVFTATPGVVLTCTGLGSCIGLALLDRRAQAAGIVHVMLPERPANRPVEASPGRFADHGVPALVDAMLGLGAMRHRLEAVLIGGAQMFAFGNKEGSGMDVGTRNTAAVHAQLEQLRIPVRATATGGNSGRSMRVTVPDCEVSYREAGRQLQTIYGGAGVDRLRTAAAA